MTRSALPERRTVASADGVLLQKGELNFPTEPFMATLALIFLCGGGLGLGPSRAHAALAFDDDLDAGALALGPGARSPFPELEMDGVHAPPE